MVESIDYKKLMATTLSKMEVMQARINELETRQSEAIAVVGMACRFSYRFGSIGRGWSRSRTVHLHTSL